MVAIPLYPEFYNDVFGPIMQPGSSSHTAAPCRLGYLAHSLLGEPLAKFHVVLDTEGSFAGTFGIMNEDNAMLAGAIGMLPDDPRIFDAAKIAKRAGIDYAFEFAEMKESTHVNAIKFILTGTSGVETVPGPMGGGGGHIYAALCAVKDAKGFSDQDLLRGLFIAAGIGAIAYTRTEPTGECIGCTGECGVCGGWPLRPLPRWPAARRSRSKTRPLYRFRL
jgi:L-serine deaminase